VKLSSIDRRSGSLSRRLARAWIRRNHWKDLTFVKSDDLQIYTPKEELAPKNYESHLTFNSIFDEPAISVVETEIVIPVIVHRASPYEIASLIERRCATLKTRSLRSYKTRTIIPNHSWKYSRQGVCTMNHLGVGKNGERFAFTHCSLQWILIKRNLVLLERNDTRSLSFQKKKKGKQGRTWRVVI